MNLSTEEYVFRKNESEFYGNESFKEIEVNFGPLNAFVMAWYLMIGIAGISLNGVIIFTYILMKKTKVDQYFFIQLMISDFLLAGVQFFVEETMHLHILTTGHLPYWLLCPLISFLVYFLFGTGLAAILAITVSRYFVILHNAFHKRVVLRYFTAIVVSALVLNSLVPGMLLVPPLLHPNSIGFTFDTGSVGCDLAETYYRRYLISGITLLMFATMIVCYLRIFVHFHRCRQRISAATSPSATIPPAGVIDRGSRELLKTMITIVGVYCLTYGPSTISAFDLPGIDRNVFRRVSVCLISLTTVTNPIIYFLFNIRLRKAVRQAFKCRPFTPQA